MPERYIHTYIQPPSNQAEFGHEKHTTGSLLLAKFYPDRPSGVSMRGPKIQIWSNLQFLIPQETNVLRNLKYGMESRPSTTNFTLINERQRLWQFGEYNCPTWAYLLHDLTKFLQFIGVKMILLICSIWSLLVTARIILPILQCALSNAYYDF